MAPDGFTAAADRLSAQPPALLVRAIWWGLLALVLVTLVFSFIARLDIVVAAQGRLVTTKPGIVVQPLETAVIHDIAVRVGDRVRAGQVLATLDSTFTAADVQRLTRQKVALEARLARLSAQFHETGFTRMATAEDAEAGLIEAVIFERWQAENAARLAAFAGQQAQLEAAIETRSRDQQVLREHLGVQVEIERMYAQLAAAQHGSRLLRLQAQSERLTIERQLTLSVNEMAELAHRRDGLIFEREAFLAGRRQAVGEELATTRRELDSVAEELLKAQRRNALVSLLAPADAVVLEMGNRSVGSVVQAAEALFTLVPADVPLEAEVWVEPADVGRLRPNDAARVKLDAYPFQRHGVATGALRVVSSDALPPAEGDRRQSRGYRALVSVDAGGMRQAGTEIQLRPGMTVTVELLVGERRLIDYVLDPIVRGLSEGLQEP